MEGKIPTIRLMALLLLLLVVFLLDIAIGSVRIPLKEVFNILFSSRSQNNTWQYILENIRIPKAFTAVLAGCGLSVGGLQMQTLFRNPLAGPDVLGITAGASLGVAAIMLAGGSIVTLYTIRELGLSGSWLIIAASCLGAAGIMLLVMAISGAVRDNVMMLIIGVMMGTITISVISIWQYFSSPELVKDYLIWNFGSLGAVTGNQLSLLTVAVVTGLVISFLSSKLLDALLLGENYARSMGLTVRRARFIIICSTSILTGSITAFCGPIGFIGIAVPHMARPLFNSSSHRILIPGCCLIGSVLMLLCDIFAQLPGSQTVLPINIVTALIGAPVVIWIILHCKQQEGLLMRNNSLLLQTSNLTVGYGSCAVAGPLNLGIRAGQLICLLGPNGSGKSTLLRTLSGLQPSLGGSTEIEGMSANRLSPARLAKKISLVLTDPVRDSNLTVYSLVALGRYPYSGWLGILDGKDRTIITQAIDAAGIGSFAERKLSTLSDGEGQKVMLARALAQDTPLLMLDEPTAHLDLPSRIQLMQLLHQLAKHTNKGILLSTHELDLALQVADEAWLLQTGGQFHRGAPEDLVLNGVFEAAFQKEGIRFDRTNGTFTIHQGNERQITLIGEGAPVFWTKRALTRQGFMVIPNHDRGIPCVRIITEEGRTAWLLEHNGVVQRHTTIAGLLQTLEHQQYNI